MVESIIDYQITKLDLTNYFDKTYCKTEIKADGEQSYPVHYVGNGNWERIQIDQFNGVAYFRVGESTSSEIDNPLTTDILFQSNFPLKLIAYKRRDSFDDDAYDADGLGSSLKKSLTFRNETLQSTLKARSVKSIVTSVNTDSANIYAEEYSPAPNPDIPFNWVVVSLDIDVEVIHTKDCMDDCPTDTDILHAFDFCNQSTFDRLTDAQKTCLTDELCGTPDPATLDINGVEVADIASGATRNQEVHNSDGGDVGSNNSGEWVVGDSTVQNNATPTWSQDIPSEDGYTLPQGKMQDSDGSTVLADYIPESEGFMFTASACTSPTITFTGGADIGYGEALTMGCSETYDEYSWHFCSQSFADTHIIATGQNPSPVLQWDGVWDVELTVRSGTSYGYAATTVTVNGGLKYNNLAYIPNTGGGWTGGDKLHTNNDTVYWGDNDNFVLLSDEQLSGEGGFIFQMGKTGIKTIGFSLIQGDPSTGFEYTSTSFKWGVYRWFNDKIQLKNGASSYPSITTIDLTDMKWFKIQRNGSNEFDLYYGDSATTNTWTHIYDFSDTDASDVYLLCYLHSGNDNNYNRVLKFGTYV